MTAPGERSPRTKSGVQADSSVAHALSCENAWPGIPESPGGQHLIQVRHQVAVARGKVPDEACLVKAEATVLQHIALRRLGDPQVSPIFAAATRSAAGSTSNVMAPRCFPLSAQPRRPAPARSPPCPDSATASRPDSAASVVRCSRTPSMHEGTNAAAGRSNSGHPTSGIGSPDAVVTTADNRMIRYTPVKRKANLPAKRCISGFGFTTPIFHRVARFHGRPTGMVCTAERIPSRRLRLPAARGRTAGGPARRRLGGVSAVGNRPADWSQSYAGRCGRGCRRP